VHDLDETLVRRSCMDVVVAVSPNPDLVDHVSPISSTFSIFLHVHYPPFPLSIVISH